MTATTVTAFVALGTYPDAFVSQNIARVLVKVPEKSSIAEEGGAFVTASPLPLLVIDATKVT